jgi:hypothetical protein
MKTNQLKRFAQAARIRLLEDVKNRFLYWGIDQDGNVNSSVETTTGGYVFRGGVYNDESVPKKWDNLLNAVKHHTPNDTIEEASYIWFNRLMAIMILEKNGYDDPALAYAENGIDPVLLQNAKRGDIPQMDEQAKRQLKEYITNSQDDEALSLLLIHYCKNHMLLNRLFGRIDDYTELLLPNNLLAKDGIIELINNDEFITDADYQEVELIGWLYQFYIADKKDDVFASFKKKQKARAEDIPAATQIFTPKWIVKYLVENTAGRIWLDKHPESPIRDTMKYLVEPEDAESSDSIIDDVEALKVLDPAVGSGHFLVVAFDLLMQMYLESGYSKSNAVESIISNNLYGLDLCKRAVGLANFAVLLKGASYSPDILTKQIKPHIYATPEPYNFSRQEINDFLGGNGHHYADELEDALTQMQQAQNIGSALVIDLSSSARDFIYDRLNEPNHDAIPLDEQMLLNVISPFLYPILMLTDTYPAVVANPPYMGSKSMNTDLKDYLGTHYPKSKSDLFAVFMEVLPNLTIKNGNFGIINLPSWMFLSTFEKIRDDYISNYFIMNMLHFGRGIFGIDWGSVAFTVKKSICGDRTGEYFKLHERTFQHIKIEDIEKLFHYSYKNPDYKYDFKKYRDEDGTNEIPEDGTEKGLKIFYPSISQTNFSKIPGSPIAYWVSERVLRSFDEENLIGDIAQVKIGMGTGKNKIFVRDWWEVNHPHIDFTLKNVNELNNSNGRYFPYNKGGDYRLWYGNLQQVVWFDSTGRNYMNTMSGHRENGGWNYYFKQGLTWSFISSSKFGVRFLPDGFTFDVAGSMLFIDENEIKYVLGFLSSVVCFYILPVLNPTLNFQAGNIKSLPIKPNANWHGGVKKIVDSNISISSIDWDSRETSWDFERLPLLNNSSSLPASYSNWEEKVTEDFFNLHENEEELNRIFIDIYVLQDELTPDVALKDITILQEELDRGELESRNGELLTKKTGLPIKKDVVIKQLLSYATGCFMGRYRLDKSGLNIAHPKPTEDELSGYDYNNHAFEIDDDAIIPTMGSDSPFHDDIVARTKEFIQMVWGDESLTENLNFINEALGENIEKYLTKKFWTDHKKTYKKKPIYWEFASPKGAFKAIVYMHRMNRFTVQKIRQDYLFKQMNWFEKQIEHTTQNESSLSSKELKTLDNYRKDLIECREYDLILKDMSDRQIDFDLDDGVTENYKLFEGVVSKI